MTRLEVLQKNFIKLYLKQSTIPEVDLCIETSVKRRDGSRFRFLLIMTVKKYSKLEESIIDDHF